MKTETLPLPRGNRDIANFYDCVHWLYPVVDVFCAAGRRRLIEHINLQPPGALLDVGVGPGRHLRHYRGHAVTAIDCSPRMVAASRRHSPGTTVRQMDGERLEFADATFDYVALCHVLSVTHDPERMLKEAHRVLRRNGKLFVLNHETPDNAWGRLETRLAPLGGWLRFRTEFRVDAIAAAGLFRKTQLGRGGVFGMISAYLLQK